MKEKFDECIASIPYAKRIKLEKQIEDYHNSHKGCKPLTMLLFDCKPKQKPKEYIKPNWELKANILEDAPFLVQLHKKLHHTEKLLDNVLNCSRFDLAVANQQCALKFDFLGQESKIYEGQYWLELFSQLQADFESHYCQEFTRENVVGQFYIGFKNTFDYLKEFSTIKEDIKSWCDVFFKADKQLKNTTQIDYWQECERLNNSFYKKRNRIKDKVKQLLEQPCIWLTFTFNDKTLQRTSEDTRRQKVRRLLSEFNTHYLGNIDYGEKNEREHYHIVLQCERVDLDLLNSKYKKYGSINVKKIQSQADYERLGNYINKLTNHALKKTKLKTRLLYDRI